MDLSEYDEVRRTKLLIYGRPKSGKTARVGKLAAAGYTLHWFDCENGVKTLMNPDVLPVEFRKNVKLYNIPDNRSMPIAISTFRDLFKGGVKKLCYTHGVNNCPVCSKTPGLKWSDPIDLAKFTDSDILVIDSLTQVSNSALNKIVLKDWQKDDEYKPTWENYRHQGMVLDEILSRIQSSNINVAVISHDIDIEKSDSKEKIVPVGGTRNFSATVAKYFDEVVYCMVQNKKHGVYNATTYSNTVLTGGRSGVILEGSGDGKEVDLAELFRPKKG